MDFQPDEEIAFKRNPDEVLLDVDEDASKATVKIPGDEDLSGREHSTGHNVVLREDSTSMIHFLVNEVQALKSRNEELAEQIRKQSVPPPMDRDPHSSHRSDPPPMVHMVHRSERRSRQNISPPPPDDGADDGFDDDVDDEISLASSKMVGFVPIDHGRWKFSKAS